MTRSSTRSASPASPASTECPRRCRSATSRKCRRPACRSRSGTSRTRTTTTRTRSRLRRTRTACSRALRARRVGLRPDAARVRPGVRDVLQPAPHDGITRQNTLFVFTADENDHFAGGNSSDGTWSHTFCNIDAGQQCPANQIGEVNANLLALIPSGQPNFSMHNDSAPTVYVNGDPPRTDATLRKLERDVAAARATDPYMSKLAAADHALPRGQGRREDAAHGDRGSTADAVVHAVRQPGLLPDRGRDLDRGADQVQLPGLGAPGVRLHRLPLRVEPRRRDRGHRTHLARNGRARASSTSG